MCLLLVLLAYVLYITMHGSENVKSVFQLKVRKKHIVNPTVSRSFRYCKISILHGRIYERLSLDKCDAVYSYNI